MNKKEIISLIMRYGTLVLLGIWIDIIYIIFTPLTVFPVYWILDWIYGAGLIGKDLIVSKGIFIQLAGVCIAGSAYYLLLLLNFTTSMDIRRRVKSLLFTIAGFLILNILRIFFMVVIFFNLPNYFDLTHKLFWYIGSTIIVVAIWFSAVKIFKIKDIPFYSDIKNISRSIK